MGKRGHLLPPPLEMLQNALCISSTTKDSAGPDLTGGRPGAKFTYVGLRDCNNFMIKTARPRLASNQMHFCFSSINNNHISLLSAY